jgi:acyl-CoA dehydrogenase
VIDRICLLQENEIIPVAAEHDLTMKVKFCELDFAKCSIAWLLADESLFLLQYPWEVIKKGWNAGLLNVHVPEKYGGSGLSVFSSSLVSEELARGCTGTERLSLLYP